MEWDIEELRTGDKEPSPVSSQKQRTAVVQAAVFKLSKKLFYRTDVAIYIFHMILLNVYRQMSHSRLPLFRVLLLE